MSDRGCERCDGQGFVFKHVGDDVLMEACPSCGSVTDLGPGHKGFWLSVAWSPDGKDQSDPQSWKARIIEETNGRVVFRALDPEKLSEVCSSGKLGLMWLSVIVLSSEMASMQQENRDLRRRIERLESMSVFLRMLAFLKRIVGRR